MRRHALVLALITGASACVSGTISTTQQPAPATASPAVPGGIRWFAAAAEQRAAYVQTYRFATATISRLAQGRSAGSWGVILDADETVLDNSDYEKSRVPFGGTYDSAAWTAWVQQGRAPALPGAARFTARVHEMGGKVVIVTNRTEAECAATRANLAQVAIAADLVLCRGATGDKNPRFQAVQNGTAQPGFPAIAVLEWLGDNIEDFPALKQTVRTLSDSALAHFGNDYFALPNAMYGSWQSNPRQ